MVGGDQARLGLRDDGNAFDRACQLDCFTGAWIGDVPDNLRGDEASLLLSPGDLDEAMQSMPDLKRLAETKFEDDEKGLRPGGIGAPRLQRGCRQLRVDRRARRKRKKKRKAGNGTGDGVGGGLLD